MADTFPIATRREHLPVTRSLERSGDTEGSLQEPDIKRRVKTKQINLTSFAELNDATRWKQLNSLINAGQGPLRLRKEEVDGKQVLYLRPRTLGQYLYEMLFLFPAEQEARCGKVRAAIQMYIRPYLDVQTATTVVMPLSREKRTSSLLNTERMAMLDRLDCRVYTDRIDPSSFFGTKPSYVSNKKRGDRIFCQDVRRAYHGTTTVPKGLSIAKIAPFKVTADVRILTKETHMLADKSPTPGENSSPPDQWTSAEKKQPGRKNALRNYYMSMLNAYGQNKRTIVLEVADDSDGHWLSAYDAASQWLAGQPVNDKPSVMLVPLHRINDFLPSKHSKAHNQGWSALMAEKLKMKDVKVPNRVSSPPCSGFQFPSVLYQQ